MRLPERIDSFVELGNRLEKLCTDYIQRKEEQSPFLALLEQVGQINPWFTPSFIVRSLQAIISNLKRDKLETWLSQYPEIPDFHNTPKIIGVVLAGNIPFAGFHDFLCTLITGNHFKGKLSSKDGGLMKFIAGQLSELNPEFDDMIHLEETRLSVIDAIIATGSDNTSRYFEFYFSRHPHIIRKNRNSVALLSGHETIEELKGLTDDIFLYFGLGCRSVSKIFVPKGYNFKNFFETMESYKFVLNHHKYANNYEYYKIIYLMNNCPHKDNGFMLLKEDANYASPISVLFFEYYSAVHEMKRRIRNDHEKIQCIASSIHEIEPKVKFGKTQTPELDEYADNMDTMKFILMLN